MERIVCTVTTTQLRQDGLRFRFVLVRVVFKIYSYRVVPIEKRGHSVEQLSMFRSKSATVFQNLIACFDYVV
jgi:hypothetical protein